MPVKADLNEVQARVILEKIAQADAMDVELLRREHASLTKIGKAVAAGDRESMLQLIEITARTLRLQKVVPATPRKSLVTALESMVSVLSHSQDFPRGKKSAVKKRNEESASWGTAFHVESIRYIQGLKLDEAIGAVAESRGISEDVVQKRWKRDHKSAKETLVVCDAVADVIGHIPAGRKKKVR